MGIPHGKPPCSNLDAGIVSPCSFKTENRWSFLLQPRCRRNHCTTDFFFFEKRDLSTRNWGCWGFVCFFLCVFSDILVDEANWLAFFEEDLHGISTRFHAGFLFVKAHGFTAMAYPPCTDDGPSYKPPFRSRIFQPCLTIPEGIPVISRIYSDYIPRITIEAPFWLVKRLLADVLKAPTIVAVVRHWQLPNPFEVPVGCGGRKVSIPSGKRSQKTMERSTIFNGKIHYKWPFSIAM